MINLGRVTNETKICDTLTPPNVDNTLKGKWFRRLIAGVWHYNTAQPAGYDPVTVLANCPEKVANKVFD
jgi:hypothetical protein